MKTTLKDCPSVHQVLLELNVNIQLHEDYIKHIINSELAKIRANIKKGKLSKTKGKTCCIGPQRSHQWFVPKFLM